MPKFFTFRLRRLRAMFTRWSLGFWIGRFSEEENRPHVHVLKFGSDVSMKVWLEPETEVEYIRGINPATANKILSEIR